MFGLWSGNKDLDHNNNFSVMQRDVSQHQGHMEINVFTRVLLFPSGRVHLSFVGSEKQTSSFSVLQRGILLLSRDFIASTPFTLCRIEKEREEAELTCPGSALHAQCPS